MGWVKWLADDVIQDRMGHADLEFAWADPRPADPAEQAKMLGMRCGNRPNDRTALENREPGRR
ncbi:MAG: hypothetical protein ACHQC9_03075 [Alphaproteobacteria bacterium]